MRIFDNACAVSTHATPVSHMKTFNGSRDGNQTLITLISLSHNDFALLEHPLRL